MTKSINCKGELIDLSTPKVMGILNVTPDSFYDGGAYKNDKDILSQVEKMLEEGATFIDVGGYSSRPNAENITPDDELKRVIPVIDILVREFPKILISIDTFRSKVAQHSINAGACMINDISAGMLDDNMLHFVASMQVPYVMMHMRGTPQTMSNLTDYNNLIKEVLFYFSERVATARQLQIIDIIVDPGFGFAKTLEQNYELLSKLEHFQYLDLPLLVGVSRKSMISKVLGTSADESLNGTSVLNTIALQKGAYILRVHDVKEGMECIKLTNQLRTR
ncbi:MAG: dihydropteroate synthase [Melioribacteraceae bacterium]|nr:dihydropteroate synthase [Melioribacteraceae bacterium]